VSGNGVDPANAADFSGVLASGTVSFAAGDTSRTVTVNVSGDAIVEPNETFLISLSSPSLGAIIGTATAGATILNDDVVVAVTARDDAYIVTQDQALSMAPSVLLNDKNATTATLVIGPAHGTLALAGDGSFSYTPPGGFAGIDSFSYRAGNGGSTADGKVLLHVVPTLGTVAPTLNLLALDSEEQVALTYAAFFGRGADAAGFEFWLGEFTAGRPQQGAANLIANIASAFAMSDEARGLYPFLANPGEASDGDIRAFLDTVYDNLFHRSSDSAGLGYWTSQIRQALASGEFVGAVLVDILSGTQAGADMAALMGKVAVGLEFVHQQQAHRTPWNGASDQAAAAALLDAVTSDPQSVLIGISQVDAFVAAHA
jgi:hypothetical protein